MEEGGGRREKGEEKGRRGREEGEGGEEGRRRSAINWMDLLLIYAKVID